MTPGTMFDGWEYHAPRPHCFGAASLREQNMRITAASLVFISTVAAAMAQSPVNPPKDQ